jgi:hypothetical protein
MAFDGNPSVSRTVPDSPENPVQPRLYGVFSFRSGPVRSVAIHLIWGCVWGYSYMPQFQIPPMPLTDIQIRKEKPGDKPRKLADGGGLYLLVNQTGKYWRWKYRYGGKEKVRACRYRRNGPGDGLRPVGRARWLRQRPIRCGATTLSSTPAPTANSSNA